MKSYYNVVLYILIAKYVERRMYLDVPGVRVGEGEVGGEVPGLKIRVQGHC